MYQNEGELLFNSHRICMAPMMDYTDRHDRYFMRLISKHALLYTEMVTTGAILFGDKNRHLDFSSEEHPVAIQLGGSDPQELAQCARLCEEWGYDEINLNVGCPSDRVQSGQFGACLMAEPQIVADCVKAMVDVVSVPVTVKTRIGIDNRDSYEELCEFIETVSQAGCKLFVIHARKCWLKGLSPRQNREIPPLRYEVVYQLKRDYPELFFVLNGGIHTLEQAASHQPYTDGVMIGRAAYDNPWLFAEVDQRFFGKPAQVAERVSIIQKMEPYVAQQLSRGVPLSRLLKPLFNLFHGQAGGKRWRRYLSEHIHKPGADWQTVLKGLDQLGIKS